MKLRFLLILFIFGIREAAVAQSLELLRVFPVEEAIAVSADPQGNIYLSLKKGEIQKYNQKGLLLHTYSPQSAGIFNVIDGSSALQVKAFSENSQSIVYLDRFLNQTASFRLPGSRFNFVSALCWSAGNTVWLADAAEMQLVRWNTETREESRTLNLNQFIRGEIFEINLLKEHQHKLYLFSAEQLYLFDQLGNYEMQVPLLPWKSIAFSEEEIILLGKDGLTFLNLYNFKEKRIPLPEAETEYRHVSYSRGEVCLFNLQEAHIYRTKP